MKNWEQKQNVCVYIILFKASMMATVHLRSALLNVCVCFMGRVLQDVEGQCLNLTRPEQQRVTDLPSVKKVS